MTDASMSINARLEVDVVGEERRAVDVVAGSRRFVPLVWDRRGDSSGSDEKE